MAGDDGHREPRHASSCAQLAPERVLLMPEADLDYWSDDLLDLVELR